MCFFCFCFPLNKKRLTRAWFTQFYAYTQSSLAGNLGDAKYRRLWCGVFLPVLFPIEQKKRTRAPYASRIWGTFWPPSGTKCLPRNSTASWSRPTFKWMDKSSFPLTKDKRTFFFFLPSSTDLVPLFGFRVERAFRLTFGMIITRWSSQS